MPQVQQGYMTAALIIILSVVLDQVSKTLVVSLMDYHEKVTVIGELLTFYRTENSGAALGMLSNARWVFIVFSILAIIVGLW